MVACARNRITNLGAEFDDRLVHLRLDLLFEHDLSTLENFLDVRAQFARLRIDDRELFLDAESVGVVFPAHSGRILNPKQCVVNATRARPTRALSPQPERTCPSSNCLGPFYVRALC